MDISNSEIKEISSTNWDMKNYIDSCHKESERHTAYPEQSTEHFENVANITVDSDSVITQGKIIRVIKIFSWILTKKWGKQEYWTKREQKKSTKREQNNSTKCERNNLFQSLPWQFGTRNKYNNQFYWEIIARNLRVGTVDQVSLPTEIGGSVNYR